MRSYIGAMKLFFTCILTFLLPGAVSADSWCGFDLNFVGTKAEGYISPGGTIVDSETGDCVVESLAAPREDAEILHEDCGLFLAFDYQEYWRYQENERSKPSPDSEYYSLQAFGRLKNYREIRLATGESRWIEFRETGERSADENWYYTSANWKGGALDGAQLYGAPDFDTPLRAPSWHGAVPQAFYEQLYPDLQITDAVIDGLTRVDRGSPFIAVRSDQANTRDKTSEIPIELLALYQATYWLEDYHGFDYRVIGTRTAEDGSLWHLAEERIAAHVLREVPEPVQKAFAQKGHNTFFSDVIRLVHIPIRDADGVVLNVYLPGPYCD